MDKGIIICLAVTALGGTVTFAVLWGSWLSYFDEGQLTCNVNPMDHIDVIGRWKIAVELNMWTYIIMSISSLLAMVGAFVAAVRLCNAIIQVCCLGSLQLAAIIYLGIVRYDTNGSACAEGSGNLLT